MPVLDNIPHNCSSKYIIFPPLASFLNSFDNYDDTPSVRAIVFFLVVWIFFFTIVSNRYFFMGCNNLKHLFVLFCKNLISILRILNESVRFDFLCSMFVFRQKCQQKKRVVYFSSRNNFEIRIKLIPFAQLVPAKGFHLEVVVLMLKLNVILAMMEYTSLRSPGTKTAMSE